MEPMFLRKESQNSEMLFEMLFTLIRFKYSSSSDRAATAGQGSLQKEYRLVPISEMLQKTKELCCRQQHLQLHAYAVVEEKG